MNRLLLAIVLASLYVLHQDLWFWRDARPLVLGFLPPGLAYHAAYCVAIALTMWVLTRVAWPAHLDPPAPAQLGAPATETTRDAGR